MRPKYELAQIIQEYGTSFIHSGNVLKQHQRVLHALKICRTSALGGHVERCNNEQCQHERIAYNSCRNRHCPKCQTTNKERWIQARKADLLPCTYFHVVFTLPQELNHFCLKYPKEMYQALFQMSKDTLFQFGAHPKHLGAKMGAISILHTWGQNLSLHPHVHMIVPGGGFAANGVWKNSASNGSYLFCAKAMAKVYKGKFMERVLQFLKEKGSPMDAKLRRLLYDKNWVVYAKEPFKGPDAVIEYLGRYTHKIAISNHRIKKIENGMVTFSYKDYKHGSVQKLMSLKAEEFLRRFCLHILPPKFVKLRHYGFLASRSKRQLKIEQLRQGILADSKSVSKEKMDFKEIAKTFLGFDVEQCPCCKVGKMEIIYHFDAHAPPPTINHKNKMLPIRNKKNS